MNPQKGVSYPSLSSIIVLSVFNTDDGKLEYPGVVGDPIIPRLVNILYDGQLISLLSPNTTPFP